jgi:hypothetical protein
VSCEEGGIAGYARQENHQGQRAALSESPYLRIKLVLLAAEHAVERLQDASLNLLSSTKLCTSTRRAMRICATEMRSSATRFLSSPSPFTTEGGVK